MTVTHTTEQVQPLRKLIHLSGAAFPLLYLITSRRTVLVVAFIALFFTVAIEWGRQHWSALERMFVWLIGSALRHGEESRPTAGTWSMLGIVITILIFKKEFAIPAMFYAQLGDPAAEMVGRRWGQHRIPNGKSLEGSLGCLAVSIPAGLVCARLLPLTPGIAAVGALVATLAEAVPLLLGDNLLMAPLAGFSMALTALAFQ